MKTKTFSLGLIAVALSSIISTPALAVTLQEAVKQTLATNPDILVETNERLARDEERKQARAGYFPSVDVSAGIGHEWSNNPTTRATLDGEKTEQYTRGEGAITMRQMLFDGFATSSEVDRQKARVNSQAFRIHGTAQNTAQRAVEVYLELLRRERLLALARENLAAHEKTYDQIKLRSESGVGRKADLDQIEGRLALARTNVIAEESNLFDAQTNYLRVVGELPKDSLEKPTVGAKMPGSLDLAVEQAVANHPTLQSAEADVEATRAQHRAAKHRFYPRFDLELSRTWDNELDGVDGTNEEEQIMVRMRWNIFNGGRDYARRKQTAHLINEASEVRNGTRRQVVESIRLSWNAYEATRTQLTYRKQHLESSRKTRDAYTKQFNIGQRTLLDLLDSENELFEAGRAYVNADTDNLFSQYRILTGTGTLIESLGLSLPEEASLHSSNQ
ncbi:MAG: TolC family outer membrane protein [Granulosicoccaceae bacterium]|jgi:adhesin transport system outer membrane protein